MRIPKIIAIVALLACTFAAIAAPPYTITTGGATPGAATITTAQNYDNLRSLSNLWTVTTANVSTGTVDPLWTFNNTASGTASKSILSLQRTGVDHLVFFVGDDRGFAIKESNGTDNALDVVYNPGDPTVYIGADGATNALELYAGSGADVKLTQADGTIVTGGMTLLKSASPPYACDATHEGGHYWDTSHAGCACDGTTWTKYVGAGTCT